MIKTQKDKNEGTKVPNLRFPGFTEEWESEKIGSILTIGSGKDYKHLSKGTIPVFGTGGYMTSVNEYLYDGESVCIGRKGTINKPSYVNGKFWTVDTLFFTHSFQRVLPKFVYYIFEQVHWLKYNEASGVPSLSKSTIEQIEINIPCIEEQQKIATFLSLLDSRIQTQNKIIRELIVLKSATAQKIFSQKLRFKDENGNDYSKWELKELAEVMSIPEKIKATIIDKNKLLTVKLHLKGVLKNENTDTLSLGATNYFIRKKGQFIYGKQNLFNGAFDIIPDEFDGFLSSGDVPTLDINHSKIIASYLLYFLGREEFYTRLEDIASGSGSKRIHENTLLAIKINLPSVLEQIKIANCLSSIDAKIEIEAQLLQKLEEQKKFLMQQMFV